MAEIIALDRRDETRSTAAAPADTPSEVIVFPRTNIRVLRRLWGLPEYGPIIAGPDGRAIGALGEDVTP